MKLDRIHSCIRTLLCAFIVSGLLLPVSFSGVQKAHAQIIVNDILGTIQTTLTALSTQSLEQKELVWDGLFFDIAQQALQQMTNDILKWVNSGFDGEPAFVTDLLGYLRDIADDVAGDFIYGEGLSTICTPFKIDVVTTIGKEYQEAQHGKVEDRLECSIDKIQGGNPQAFLKGQISAGGWSMWFETVLNPENTAIGAKLIGQRALGDEVAKHQAAAVEDYRAGEGFPSQKVCTDGPNDCIITTPGSVIADQVSFALQIPALRLLQADEMNEVIGALFGNLANQAITGVNGLLGLGGNASFSVDEFGVSGSLSYLDAISEEQVANTSAATAGGNRIEQALRTETQVLELQLAIVTELDGISSAFLEAQEPYEDDSCWNLDFPESLSDKLDELIAEVPTTIETVVALETLLEEYNQSTDPSSQMTALRKLSQMQSEGALAGRTAVIEYDFYLKSELRSEVEDLTEAIEDEIDSC